MPTSERKNHQLLAYFVAVFYLPTTTTIMIAAITVGVFGAVVGAAAHLSASMSSKCLPAIGNHIDFTD